MLNELCASNPARLGEAEAAAIRAIEARIEFWDGVQQTRLRERLIRLAIELAAIHNYAIEKNRLYRDTPNSQSRFHAYPQEMRSCSNRTRGPQR